MTTLKIRKVENVSFAGEDVLDVTFDIIEQKNGKENVVSTQRHSFPLNTDREDLTKELRKTLDVYTSEQARKGEQAKIDAANENASELKQELEGLEITSN